MYLEMSRQTDIAIRVLRRLSATELTSGSTLATSLDTTTTYLARILSPLVRAGWITSKQGPSGGYALNVDPCDVSILDVIEAVEGPVDRTKCVLRNTDCSSSTPCSVHGAWSRARDALTRELKATSVVECTPGRST